MLRIIKWAYDLGIKHERIRIASHLSNLSHSARVQNDAMFDIMREEKTSKKRREQLDFDRAVNDHVQRIISDIMRPEEHREMGASIMFPDVNKKGEIK